MRVIPHEIPSFESLRLPPQLAEIAEIRNGVVLLTGPTGSGKSSTLAAIIDRINEIKALSHCHDRGPDRVSAYIKRARSTNARSVPIPRILHPLCGPLFVRHRRSFSSARCVISRQPRSLSKPPKPATLCFRLCTRSMLRRPSTVSSDFIPRTKSGSSARGWHKHFGSSFRSD